MDTQNMMKSHRKGFTMVEVVVALAILMVAAAAFLPVFIFAAKSSINSNVRLIATNLAQSEIEHIKAMDYDVIGTHTTVNSVNIPGNPDGTIEREKAVVVGNRSFNVVTDVRYKSATNSGQTDSMAYKQVNVVVQYLSGFSGAQVNFANMDALVSREGERTIVNAGDLQAKVTYRGNPKAAIRVDVRLDPDVLSPITTMGTTDTAGSFTFAGLTPSMYYVQPQNPTTLGMVVKPNNRIGSGYNWDWVYSLGFDVQSWSSNLAEFEVDWPARLNLALEDFNGNAISSTGMIVSIEPEFRPELQRSLSLGNLSIQDLWPGWAYNLRIFPEATPNNVFNLFAVNDGLRNVDIMWDGKFPEVSAAQTLSRTMTVMADQPTVFTPATYHKAATPLASLMEADVNTKIPLHAQPSFSSVLYSTDGNPPSKIWDSVTAPDVPLGATPQNPFVITAKTQALKGGTRIVMDSPSAQFNYITTGSATAPFSIKLSSTTSGAQIRYTTDGSEPSSTSTPYIANSLITIDRTMTVKAAAFKTGWYGSDTSVFNYTMKAASPTAEPLPGTIYGAFPVTLSTTTSNAQIYYTTIDLAPPTSSIGQYTLYNSDAPIQVATSVKISAFTRKANWTDSDMSTFAYNILTKVADPTATLPSGTYEGEKSVRLSTATPGATIYYTTDGNNPSTLSIKYTAGESIPLSANTTLKAIATKQSLEQSNVSTYIYTINMTVATPDATPGTGTYTGPTPVVLTCASSDATIMYQVSNDDGTFGTMWRTYVVGNPIQIDRSKNIQAKAVKVNMQGSSTRTFSYTLPIIVTVLTPDPEPKEWVVKKNTDFLVVLKASPDNAEIYYNINKNYDPILPANRIKYLGPIAIKRTSDNSNTFIFKVIAYGPGGEQSSVQTFKYVLKKG